MGRPNSTAGRHIWPSGARSREFRLRCLTGFMLITMDVVVKMIMFQTGGAVWSTTRPVDASPTAGQVMSEDGGARTG